MERSTGRRTKPFSIPKTVRMANTAKKYLKNKKMMNVSWNVNRKKTLK